MTNLADTADRSDEAGSRAAGARTELLYDQAGHAERALAFLIDVVVIWMAMYVVATVMAVFVPEPALKEALTRVIQVVGVAYFPVSWLRGGQTIGMLPFHQRVVRRSDLGSIDAVTAIVRLGALVLAILSVVGILWVFVDPERRGLHDRLAGTLVISG